MVTELKRATNTLDRIEELLGDSARTLLDHKSETIDKGVLNVPGPDFIDRVWSASDRSPAVLRSLQTLFDNGRLAGTGYLSILPVDQGIEQSELQATEALVQVHNQTWPSILFCPNRLPLSASPTSFLVSSFELNRGAKRPLPTLSTRLVLRI